MSAQLLHYHLLCLRTNLSGLINSIQQILRTYVGGHNKNRILKIHRLACGICNTAVIQHLKQYIEYIRVSLLHLVKQHYRIRFPAHSLCQLAAFIIAHISWRRSDQTGYRMLLHVLTHINTDHIVLIIKQRLCQSLGQLCFSHAGRS